MDRSSLPTAKKLIVLPSGKSPASVEVDGWEGLIL